MILTLDFALLALRTTALPPTTSNTSIHGFTGDVDFYNRFPRMSMSIGVPRPPSEVCDGTQENYIAVAA